MKKFILIKEGDNLGFISSNLKAPSWGIVPSTERENLITQLIEDYEGNISLSFPKDEKDDLTPREQLAFFKLKHYMNEEKILRKRILKPYSKEGGR